MSASGGDQSSRRDGNSGAGHDDGSGVGSASFHQADTAITATDSAAAITGPAARGAPEAPAVAATVVAAAAATAAVAVAAKAAAAVVEKNFHCGVSGSAKRACCKCGSVSDIEELDDSGNGTRRVGGIDNGSGGSDTGSSCGCDRESGGSGDRRRSGGRARPRGGARNEQSDRGSYIGGGAGSKTPSGRVSGHHGTSATTRTRLRPLRRQCHAVHHNNGRDNSNGKRVERRQKPPRRQR